MSVPRRFRGFADDPESNGLQPVDLTALFASSGPGTADPNDTPATMAARTVVPVVTAAIAAPVGGKDATRGLDVSGTTITSNAFWGEVATGTWTLQLQDISGKAIGTISSWSLTFLGDNAATVQTPLVYTPEFADLLRQHPDRPVGCRQGHIQLLRVTIPRRSVCERPMCNHIGR
jgi:hypothetical protein